MNAVRDLEPPIAPAANWAERNQRWLVAQIGRVHGTIGRRLRTDGEAAEVEPHANEPLGSAPSIEDPHFVPALLHCATLFGLSAFERDMLLLAAGVELDAGLRQAVARVQTLRGEPVTALASFSLALALLDEPHWDALSPQAPLRRWRLLAMDDGASLTGAPLRVDERVLHFITGVAAADERLRGIARFIWPDPHAHAGGDLPARIAQFLQPFDARPPLAILGGGDVEAQREAALAVAVRIDSPLLWLRAEDLPTDPQDLADIGRLLDREVALTGALLALQLDEHLDGHREYEHRAARLLEQMNCAALLLGQLEPRLVAGLTARRVARVHIAAQTTDAAIAAALARAGLPAIDVGLLDADPSAADLPAASLPPANLRGVLTTALRQAGQQFRIGARAMDAVLEQITSGAAAGPERLHSDGWARQLHHRIWMLSREAARGGLGALAQRIDSRNGFDDIVLPPAQMHLLREIGAQLRHRTTVYDDWGFAAQSNRGLGLCALFAGESGTGKTLAAEAIANEAQLDLYRIDLASVVSKYIGETEKNLKRVFDAAEASGAVLLFDEADALFGKRSEVKDSHDRYANLEVAYLLQRIEAYRGLAILTTNLKGALDRSFLRRIRFVVQFPYPDARAREQIWRHQFGPAAPVGALDFAALAQLNLAGGNIRSVALNAAFKAADDGGRIEQSTVIAAARAEFAKLERSFDERASRTGAA